MANAKKNTDAATVDDRAFTRLDHDARAAEQGESDKVGDYTVDELKAMLARNGTVPEGISYSPYSVVPFVATTEADHERILASHAHIDQTVNYPNAVIVATAAGPSGVPAVGASTAGDTGSTPSGSAGGGTSS